MYFLCANNQQFLELLFNLRTFVFLLLQYQLEDIHTNSFVYFIYVHAPFLKWVSYVLFGSSDLVILDESGLCDLWILAHEHKSLRKIWRRSCRVEKLKKQRKAKMKSWR